MTAAPAAPTPPTPALRRSRRNRLRALNPFDLLFGPIFLKEVIVSARRRAAYLLRTSYALILVAVATFALYIAWDDSQHGGTAQRLADYSSIAPRVASIVGWLQFVLLTLFGAISCAGAFSEERQARTLHSLMSTPLTSAQIVFGKLSSKLLQLVILALVPLPILLVLRVYGGLETQKVIAFTALSIISGGFAASLAMLLSIFNRRAWSVVVLAGVLLGLLYIAPVVLSPMLGFMQAGRLSSFVLFALAILSPLYTLAMFEIGSWTGMPGLFPATPWLLTAAALVGGTFALSLLSALVLRPLTLREPSRTDEAATPTKVAPSTPAAPVASPAGSFAAAAPASNRRRRRGLHFTRLGMAIIVSIAAVLIALVTSSANDFDHFPWYLIIAMPLIAVALDLIIPTRRHGDSRHVGDRPILWRELRSTINSGRYAAIALTVIVAAILVLAYRGAEYDDSSLHLAVTLAFAGIHFLAAAVMTTSRFASEREARTWDTLLCTPLTARHIVLSKLAAGVAQLLPIPALLLLHYLIFNITGHVPVIATIHVMSLLLAYTIMLAATGLLLGLVVRRSTSAAVFNLGFAGAIWIGLPILSILLGEFLFHNEDHIATVTMIVNAPYLLGVAIGGAFDAFSYGNMYRYIDESYSPAAFTGIVLTSAAIALAIAFLAVWRTIAILRRRSLRDR